MTCLIYTDTLTLHHFLYTSTDGGDTWTSAPLAKMYDQHVPGWCHEPELLSRADRIPDEKLWAAHQEAKQALVDKGRELTGVVLNPDQPILGFARRMTAYKRADLLFTDLARLKVRSNPEAAAALFAWASADYVRQGWVLAERLHPENPDDLRSVRAALGERGLLMARSAGVKLSVDEALAIALEEGNGLPANLTCR